ncbi:hypothetical protein WJX74_010028 [Apatococcus lobatus]|uniref:Cation/H+ exchanger transmembrane domain-containing protein n=1 Tax=Apatococcus lobatus TaxID=904363 RepID=A0AAW1RY32_9CHLO
MSLIHRLLSSSESSHEAALAEESSSGENLSTVLMVFAVVIWFSLGHHLAHVSRYIGHGSAASLVGLVIGAVILVLRGIGTISTDTSDELLTFNHSSFFTFFLPPIILYAGLSVRKKSFFANFATIASLGIAGTYVAFSVIAAFLLIVAKATKFITLADCLALGCIFATTDSVAVLSVLDQDRAPLLFSLMFGEGVINDATSVALLHVVEGLGPSPTINGATIFIIFAKFFYLFILSLILGIAFGLGGAWMLKQCDASSTPQAVGLIGTTCYLSYLAGDEFKLSGIVSLFCCAVAMSHYGLHNISKHQRAASLSAFETLSSMAEGSVFVYVGLDSLDPQKWAETYITEVIYLFFVVMILLFVSRAAFLYPILLFHKKYGREALTHREITVAWFAGAMRGAVSVALVYYYYDPDGKTYDRQRSTLIAMTLAVVLISTLFFGAVTKPLLDLLLGPQEPAHGAHGDQAIELQKHKSPGPDAHGPSGGIGVGAAPMYSTVDVDESGYESDKTDATAFSDSYLVPFEQEDEEEDEDEPDTAGFISGRSDSVKKPISILIKPAGEVQQSNEPVHPLPQLSLKSQPTGTFIFGQNAAAARVPDPHSSSPTLSGWGSGIPAGAAHQEGPPSPATAEWVTFDGDQAPKRLPPRPSEVGDQSWEIQPAPASGPPVAFSSTEMAAVQSRLGRVIPAEHIHRVRFSTDHLGPAPTNPAGGGIGERPSKLRRLKTGGQQQPRFASVMEGPREDTPPPPDSTAEKQGQIAEWWATFDKRYMRPVFTKPEAEWSPRVNNPLDSPNRTQSMSAIPQERRRMSASGGIGDNRTLSLVPPMGLRRCQERASAANVDHSRNAWHRQQDC